MLHGKRKKARAAALETIMVLSDKFSTQNRRTKKTTKPALAATKLPNRIAKQRPWILRGRRPPGTYNVLGPLFSDFVRQELPEFKRLAKGLIACGI
jgi:hypothetical protein